MSSVDTPDKTEESKAPANGASANTACGQNTTENKHNSARATFLDLLANSYVVWAFIAILSLDLFCRLEWKNLNLDHYASPNRSMVWWNVDDFRKQKEMPDVVLVGSSLLMHVLHGGDAEYLQLAQNEVYHHKARYFEDLLSQKTGVKVNSFAFALAGQMASDAYTLCSTLFSSPERKPKLIIYNVAPRDFMDNTLGSLGSTEIYRFMSRLGGGRDIAWEVRRSLWEKLEMAAENASKLYEQRHYFVYLQHRYVKSILKAICGYKITDEVHTPFALRRLALRDLPEDMGTNERICLPNLEANYTDNSDEYRKRYQPFKQKKYMSQLAYLEKLQGFCKNQGIQLIMVNMPLTQDNIKLLPPGAYDIYIRNLTAIAAKYGGRFIDLQDPSYDKSLYCDTAHMTGKGGMKFFRELTDKLADGSELSIAESRIKK